MAIIRHLCIYTWNSYYYVSLHTYVCIYCCCFIDIFGVKLYFLTWRSTHEYVYRVNLFKISLFYFYRPTELLVVCVNNERAK